MIKLGDVVKTPHGIGVVMADYTGDDYDFVLFILGSLDGEPIHSNGKSWMKSLFVQEVLGNLEDVNVRNLFGVRSGDRLERPTLPT